MIEKRIEGTDSALPKGNRELDAPTIVLELDSLMQQIKEDATFKNNDKHSITIVKTEGMRIVMIALKPGAELKTHTAPGAISVQVLEGKIQFNTENASIELYKGQLLTLQLGLAHSVTASLESIFLLTISMPAARK